MAVTRSTPFPTGSHSYEVRNVCSSTDQPIKRTTFQDVQKSPNGRFQKASVQFVQKLSLKEVKMF
eukprot:2129453-Amphidinium_carterae.1